MPLPSLSLPPAPQSWPLFWVCQQFLSSYIWSTVSYKWDHVIPSLRKNDALLRFAHVLQITVSDSFLWLCSIILCGQPGFIGSVFGTRGLHLVLDSWLDPLWIFLWEPFGGHMFCFSQVLDVWWICLTFYLAWPLSLRVLLSGRGTACGWPGLGEACSSNSYWVFGPIESLTCR